MQRKKRKQADVKEEEKGCDADGSETAQSSPVKSRRSFTPFDPKVLQCFFCEKNDFASNLRLASTLELDKKVRECAILLNDSKLIAKLSTGDLIAIEAKHHAACLVKQYNRARPLKKQCSDATDSSSVDLEELAFAELIGYIEECLEQEAPGVLTLSELVGCLQWTTQTMLGGWLCIIGICRFSLSTQMCTSISAMVYLSYTRPTEPSPP